MGFFNAAKLGLAQARPFMQTQQAVAQPASQPAVMTGRPVNPTIPQQIGAVQSATSGFGNQGDFHAAPVKNGIPSQISNLQPTSHQQGNLQPVPGRMTIQPANPNVPQQVGNLQPAASQANPAQPFIGGGGRLGGIMRQFQAQQPQQPKQLGLSDAMGSIKQAVGQPNSGGGIFRGIANQVQTMQKPAQAVASGQPMVPSGASNFMQNISHRFW